MIRLSSNGFSCRNVCLTEKALFSRKAPDVQEAARWSQFRACSKSLYGPIVRQRTPAFKTLGDRSGLAARAREQRTGARHGASAGARQHEQSGRMPASIGRHGARWSSERVLGTEHPEKLTVGLERLLKAFDPFLMVEAKAPIQSEVEPALCLGRTGGDMAGLTPEVEVLHAFPVNSTRLWLPPRLCGRTCSPKETGATLRTEQLPIVYEIVLLVFGDERFRPSSRRRGQLWGILDGSRRRGGVPAISWASRRSLACAGPGRMRRKWTLWRNL